MPVARHFHRRAGEGAEPLLPALPINTPLAAESGISSPRNTITPTAINMLAFLALAALVASASTAPAGPPAPHGPSYHEPKYEPRPYAYEYGVHDEYSGANFNAQETSDGAAVHGSYQVHLPDGRIQTVTYTADHYNGYVADVKYDGQAVYPKYEPKPYAPHPAPHKPAPYHAPAPHPAPAYKPAPAPYHPPAPAYHN